MVDGCGETATGRCDNGTYSLNVTDAVKRDNDAGGVALFWVCAPRLEERRALLDVADRGRPGGGGDLDVNANCQARNVMNFFA